MTRTQTWAKKAYECIEQVKKDEKNLKEYRSFCLAFPAKLHDWGLCQALSFAAAKKEDVYLEHLRKILDIQSLDRKAREAPLSEYQQLTRDTMGVAIWLKRYTEALIRVKD